MKYAGSRLADHPHSVYIAMLLMGGLTLWFAMTGRTDRVVYRGIDPVWAEPGVVRLVTEPPGHYVIERNADFAAMKAGCLYDLNYDVVFGRHQSNDRIKKVQRVALARC